MTRRTRKDIHSLFEGRFRLRLVAQNGDSQENIFMRDLVAELTQRHAMGVAQDWIIGAIYERFARERGAHAAPSILLGRSPLPQLQNQTHGGWPTQGEPSLPVARDSEPQKAGGSQVSASRVPYSAESAHRVPSIGAAAPTPAPGRQAEREEEEEELEMDLPEVTATVRLSPEMRGGFRVM